LPRGENLLVGHVLVWSLPMALVAWVVIRVLVQSWRLPAVVADAPLAQGARRRRRRRPHRQRGWLSSPRRRRACIFTGTPMAGAMLRQRLLELLRGALLPRPGSSPAPGTRRAACSPAPPSAAGAFGYTHTQFPMPLRVLTGLIGAPLVVGLRTHRQTCSRPTSRHELSDIILDAIL